MAKLLFFGSFLIYRKNQLRIILFVVTGSLLATLLFANKFGWTFFPKKALTPSAKIVDFPKVVTCLSASKASFHINHGPFGNRTYLRFGNT